MLNHFIKSLDDVDEKYRDLYSEVDGGFEVEVKGVAEMKRGKDREKERATAAEQRARDAEERLAALEAKLEADGDDSARKKGDTEALEKSWQAKLAKREAELLGDLDSMGRSLENVLVKSTAQSLAAEMAVEGSARVLQKHIQDRLAVDMRDGERVTVVLGEDGKPSALTLDDLRKEISSDKAFAPLIIGSRASGSGAAGGKGGGAAPKTGDMGGSKEERIASLRGKFPELAQAN